MSSTYKVYHIKWYGPYSEKQLEMLEKINGKIIHNMIYLWSGKRYSNPSAQSAVIQYCGITERGKYRFDDPNHHKNEIIVKTRLCWIGIVRGIKRKTATGKCNAGLEKIEEILIHFLSQQRIDGQKCCALNKYKKKNPPSESFGVINEFYKTDETIRVRKTKDVRALRNLIIWDGSKYFKADYDNDF